MYKMDLLGGYFNGLNLNPIPLEFSQSMSTRKELAALLAKLDQVINFTNEWYETILTDLEGDGLLYVKLKGELLSEIQIIINNIENELTTLELLSYKEPVITLNCTPSQVLYTYGETINSVILHFNVTKGSNPLVKAEIYKNNTLIDTVTTLNIGLNNYIDASIINSNTDYKILIYDDKGNISSNIISYEFVYNSYYGLASETDVINENFIKQLPQIKTLNNSISSTYSPNDNKIIFCYPSSFSNLTKILYNNNNIIEAFNCTTININNIQYILYVSNNFLTANNINLFFNWEV